MLSNRSMGRFLDLPWVAVFLIFACAMVSAVECAGAADQCDLQTREPGGDDSVSRGAG